MEPLLLPSPFNLPLSHSPNLPVLSASFPRCNWLLHVPIPGLVTPLFHSAVPQRPDWMESFFYSKDLGVLFCVFFNPYETKFALYGNLFEFNRNNNKYHLLLLTRQIV